MKSNLFSIVASLFIISLISYSFTHWSPKNFVAAKRFAVIELFTSEGCSSCPPADALLSRIQNESKDMPVYILAYHVDYWNRLGWRDAFSSAAYSKRQADYARWLHATLYTPQLVVNGSKEFVGSDENLLRNTIQTEILKERTCDVKLFDVKKLEGTISFQYHIEGAPANTSLLVALVQKKAESHVLKGENRGRNLSHVQIVRSLQIINLKGNNTGAGKLEIPESLNDQGLEVIALLQKNDGGEIVSAVKSAM